MFAVGTRVRYSWRQGYGMASVTGTVVRELPVKGGIPGQLQNEIEVRTDDGRIMGGPVGLFTQVGSI